MSITSVWTGDAIAQTDGITSSLTTTSFVPILDKEEHDDGKIRHVIYSSFMCETDQHSRCTLCGCRSPEASTKTSKDDE